MPKNESDTPTAAGFGEEWSKFKQTDIDPELEKIFNAYFSIFPWQSLPVNPVGFDLGCGSGRWAKFVAPKVEKLICIDPSEKALRVAKHNLNKQKNILFKHASVSEIPLEENSMDFGYSLGVLHHIPDTAHGIKCCVNKLKPGAPLLLYLYYALDNKPMWYRALWRLSDFPRKIISRLPFKLKSITCELIAATVYFPLAKLAAIGEKCKLKIDNFPLSFYRNQSFYTMRTDALDRFGTKLEHRFTQKQISQMMEDAGLSNITFSNSTPFWCAIGRKKMAQPS